MTRRVWLDWCAPLVPAAAAWLVEHGTRGRTCDLGRVIGVTPGRRAGRLLLVELIQAAARGRLRLTPPVLLTPGALAETLTAVRAPLATHAERSLSWTAALRAAPAEQIEPLLAQPPDHDDAAGWHALATALARVHEELSGGDLSMAEVAHLVDELAGPAEARRWRALASMAERALEMLRQAGVRDPFDAHRDALRHNRWRADAEVVLVGVTDLNALQRRILSAVPLRVVALIAAPERLAIRFDELGCVVPAGWADAPHELSDEEIIVADRPCDQAHVVLRAIAQHGADLAPDDITVALGDEGLAPTIMAAGRFVDLSFHHAAGTALARTAPLRLLAGLADWLEGSLADDLAALVRHPDLEAWFERQGIEGDLPVEFDGHMARCLPNRMHPTAATAPLIQDALGALERLLAPLHGPLRPLSAWCEPILALLRAISGDDPPGPRTVDIAHALVGVLEPFSRAPGSLQPATSGVAALRILLQHCATPTVADEPAPEQIEMVGWLEVPFDSAPLLVVTGANDGFIPRAGPNEPWLPDAIRRRAGIACDETRLARDAWILEVARHARRRLSLVAGRRDADGEPLAPSRLLLRGPAQLVARRLLRLSDAENARHFTRLSGAPAPAAVTRFTIPPPPPPPIRLESLSVTAFRAFLQCGYRFWLSRIERLQTIPDRMDELDPPGFGNLIHSVLHRFALADAAIRASDSPLVIREFIEGELRRQAQDRFGSGVRPAVRVQLARLEDRLASFAVAQAAHRAEGWLIHQAEVSLADGAMLEVPDQDALRITGKIDRIDHRPASGEWLIIDYKSSERAAAPEKVHRASDRWIDLQLPLYHHLCGLGDGRSVGLAYFNLPRATAQTGVARANWSAEVLEDAIGCARQVVRDIRAGRFRMSEDVTGARDDEWAAIAQVHVRGAASLDGEPEQDQP